MVKKGRTKKPAKLKVNKRLLWYNLFTNEANTQTFLNKTESAIQAGYKAKSYNAFKSIGCENFTLLNDKIGEWLDANKFSPNALKLKHSELLETQRTVFQKVKGKVNSTDLPEGVRIITESDRMLMSGRGEDAEPYDDGETLLAINVADPEIQRKALDMAYKVKGTYAAEKREMGGPGGGPIPLTSFPPEPKTVEEWEEMQRVEQKKLLIPEAQGQ